jgi:drug/metabolite transporter (DMT)-like permease
LGGLSARRAHVLTVLAVSQVIGLLGIVIWLVATREDWPGVSGAAPAAAAGAAGAVGLAALYRGLALGAMAIVAPISAAAPVVPLAVDAVNGITPSVVQWLGILLVLGGIGVLSREPGGGPNRLAAGVGLAVVAALGFGTFFVLIDAAADESVPWAIGTARLTAALLAAAIALGVGVRLAPPIAVLPTIAAAGLFDAGGNVAIATATTLGATGIVAVVSSLYPIVTIVLARLVLGEAVDTARRVGGLVALAGAALVAAG